MCVFRKDEYHDASINCGRVCDQILDRVLGHVLDRDRAYVFFLLCVWCSVGAAKLTVSFSLLSFSNSNSKNNNGNMVTIRVTLYSNTQQHQH